jgi:hypothetical protein
MGPDLLVLEQKPSRLSRCAGGTCKLVSTDGGMPPEDANRTNQSVAMVVGPTNSFPIVAQSGSEICDTDCNVDAPTIAGLYRIDVGTTTSPPYRVGPTMPLAFAKSGRSTDGFLVGAALGYAVGQAYSNEGPSGSSIAVFQFASTGLPGATTTAFDTSQGPVVFVSAVTPRGTGGYVVDGADLVDIRDASVSLSYRATLATLTGGPAAAAHVVATSADTVDGTALIFPNTGAALVPTTVPFDGLSSQARALFATDLHVGFVAPAKNDASPSLLVGSCLSSALVAGGCTTTTTTPLPLTSLLRTRAAGGSAYFLGNVAKGRAIVRVDLD